MKRQKITLVPTDVGKIEDVVNDILQQKEDKNKKKAHINKMLKKDEMLGKKKEEIHIDKVLEKDESFEKKKHVHSCPSCQAVFEKKQEGFEICEGCGTVDLTIKKGEKIAICNACGGIMPESFIGGDNKNCPHCGSDVGARWA